MIKLCIDMMEKNKDSKRAVRVINTVSFATISQTHLAEATHFEYC